MSCFASALRIVLSAVTLAVAIRLAPWLDGVPVTASGLFVVAVGLWALWQVARAISRFTQPQTYRPTLSAVSALTGQRPALNRARHEAAHAVVAHALGYKVLEISIRMEGASGGFVNHQAARDDRLWAFHRIAITFAGPLVEARGDVIQPHDGLMDDYSSMMRSAIAASITDPAKRTPNELLDDGTRLARRLVTDHATAIEAVAQALLAQTTTHELTMDEFGSLMNEHTVIPADQPKETTPS